MLRHQLHHVFVVRDDVHLVAGKLCLVRQRPDHIVGLKAFVLNDRYLKGFESPADVRNLQYQIGGHLRAVRLVPFVGNFIELLCLNVEFAHGCHGLRALIAKDGRHGVENGREVVRREIPTQLVDHVHENVRGCRRHAAACRHRSLPLHRVIGAEDEGHRVQQKNWRLFFGIRHGAPAYEMNMQSP